MYRRRRGTLVRMDAADPTGEMDEYELEQRRREERRAVDEAGGGESEGFELAEEEMIEHTSHGDEHSTQPILHDAAAEGDEEAAGDADAVFGEPDEEIKPD
ncbi:MAG: hypothetical protein QOI89_2656 [Solirubrobacteraceae bacterium]|jgi:hypothetical protein|nr:hypothetical protein [Solirubrobacteraceae bacterium]